MRVEIDKIHKDSYSKLADDVNKKSKSFKSKDYKASLSYESLLLNKDISVEKKKKALIERLHKLIIKTFSIDLSKIKSEKKILEVLKHNIRVLRKIVDKLKDINYYLEESFLAELGLIKRSLNINKNKSPERLIENAKFSLSKQYLCKLEHTTYKLIEKIILFDKKLLKGYKSKEEKIIAKEKVVIKDINNVLKKQSELFNHLEAKLPPPSKIKPLLLKKKIFNQWIPVVLTLMTACNSEYRKEEMIFEKLKKNKKIKQIINKKISSLEKEKAGLIGIKQERVMGRAKLGGLENELRIMFHDFNAVKNL
ncbi:hypothetical protein ISS05_01035 [Candidatus Woesearchaeota archaeon]|nr:hypothetical protein [Candidatus Woesearchaeota archaeon]